MKKINGLKEANKIAKDRHGLCPSKEYLNTRTFIEMNIITR